MRGGPTVNRIKYCNIYLTSTDFTDSSVDLTLLLITELIPGLSYCDGPISAKATIVVDFCEPTKCKQSWEAIETERNNRIIIKEKNSRKDENKTLETELSTVGKETKSDLNYSILIGVFFVVTLLAFSLILGLIYFWCPNICTLCCKKRRSDDDLGATKILTVRDNFGKIIPEARTVEVWKTKENKVKSYDVAVNEPKKSKKGGYNTLIEESDGSAEYSNFNSREDTQRTHRQQNQRTERDRIVLLERPRSQRNTSRLTILEELDPRTLTPYNSTRNESRILRVRDRDGHTSRKKVKLIKLDNYDRSNHPFEIVKVGRETNGQSLNFSRHYVSNARTKPTEYEYDRNNIDNSVRYERYERAEDTRKDNRHSNDNSYRDDSHIRRSNEREENKPLRNTDFQSHLTPRDHQSYNRVEKSKSTRDESSQISFFQDDTVRDINSYQYYDRRDLENSATNQDNYKSGMREAMSSISAIMEGDPSDYEDDQSVRIEDNKDPPIQAHQSTEDLQHLADNLGSPEEPPEPLSKRMLKTIGNFQDNNRTPSPAMTLAENALKVARIKRLGKSSVSGTMNNTANVNSIEVLTES